MRKLSIRKLLRNLLAMWLKFDYALYMYLYLKCQIFCFWLIEIINKHFIHGLMESHWATSGDEKFSSLSNRYWKWIGTRDCDCYLLFAK